MSRKKILNQDGEVVAEMPRPTKKQYMAQMKAVRKFEPKFKNGDIMLIEMCKVQIAGKLNRKERLTEVELMVWSHESEPWRK